MDDGRLDAIERRMEDLDKRESAMERTMDKAMQRSKAAMDVIVPNEARKSRTGLVAPRPARDQEHARALGRTAR